MTENAFRACGASCAIGLGEDDPAEARKTTRRWIGIAVGAVLAGNAMMLSVAINTSAATEAVRLGVHLGLLGATLVTAGLLGPPLLVTAWRAGRQGRVTIEALFLTGLTGALAASLISMVGGEGPVYFETVIVLLVVYSLGHQVTNVSQRRALRSIEAWRGAPETCEVVRADGTADERRVAEVAVGERVRVHPGRMTPVDGVVAEGEAYVQESQLTGEFFSEARRPGDPIWAGSYCLDGTLTVRATVPGGQRRIDHLARAVERARANPSTLETEADRIVQWFLPTVVTIAVGTFAGWTWAWGWETGLFNAMSVLLVACPCAMGFATPVSIWSAIGRMAQRGLVLQRGDQIETLAEVDTVVFDKTGTLTEAQASLLDLVLVERGVSAEELRGMIGAAQRASDHPVAAAFYEVDAGIDKQVKVEAVRTLPGRGLVARCRAGEGGELRELAIGSEDLLETDEQRVQWESLSKRLVGPTWARRIVVLEDGRPVAAALVDERVLETGPATLEALEAMGLHVIVMTGDRPERAERLGVAEVHAGMSPEAKRDLVRRMKAAGRRVLFIGDGVNDAVAMAESQASLAPPGAAPLARETAGACLMEADLQRVPFAIRVCRRARRTIRGNLRLAAVYNTTGMVIAAAGQLHPVAAVLIMTCSSLVVSWRALRLLEDAGENRLLGSEPRVSTKWAESVPA